MSITTTTAYGPPQVQRVMITRTSTTMITPTTIIMIMTTSIPTLIRMTMTMTMTMTISRVICTTAKGKRDCRFPAWDNAS